MIPRVAVVDYGMGNRASVAKAFRSLGARADIISTPAAVEAAPVLVLPGVGAFPDAMAQLHAADIVEPVRARARGDPAAGRLPGDAALVRARHREEPARGAEAARELPEARRWKDKESASR